MEFDYTKIRQFPPLVRALAFGHGAWVVGGAAKWLVGLENELRDWDIIVPLRHWTEAQRLIPYGSCSNTFGGHKITAANQPDIDVWAQDLDNYVLTCTKNNNLILAVQPLSQVVVKVV